MHKIVLKIPSFKDFVASRENITWSTKCSGEVIHITSIADDLMSNKKSGTAVDVKDLQSLPKVLGTPIN